MVLIRMLVLMAICGMTGMTQIAHAGGWTNIWKFQRGTYYPSSPSAMTQICEQRTAIYEHTAVALSKLEAPDFSDFSEEALYDAFWAVFHGSFSANKIWLKELKGRITELSGGTVQLRRSSNKHFNSVRGPAEYLILKKGKVKIKVILGPYSTPVIFNK